MLYLFTKSLQDLIYIWNLKSSNALEAESRMVIDRTDGGENGDCQMVQSFNYAIKIGSKDLLHSIVHELKIVC